MEILVDSDPAAARRPVRVRAADLVGVDARLVDIEASARGSEYGPPRILGLPDAAVREAYHRVRTAFGSLHLSFPRGQVVVNLAPARTRKVGSGFDLGIALAVATLAGFLPRASLRSTLVVGELGLDGSLRPVPGVLSMAELARDLGMQSLLCPEESAALAACAGAVRVLPAASLDEALDLCRRGPGRARPIRPLRPTGEHRAPAIPDLSRVRGQDASRHALITAAAGGHNVLMSGPPGCGKTLLARCLPGLLPGLSSRERIEVLRIQSAFATDRRVDHAAILERGVPPFRAPHHTISYAGLIGGGNPIRPGEATLAHRGVLFLDELPEFARTSLEALRQPLESGSVHVCRAGSSLELPAAFQLIVAMNPCPCGYRGHPAVPCRDTERQVRRYRDRISGPLLDRIDIHLHLAPTPPELLLDEAEKAGPSSKTVRARIREIRQRQYDRNGGVLNAMLDENVLRSPQHLATPARRLLFAHCKLGTLSARAIARILRVGRSLADLAGHDRIQEEDLAAALQYRARAD